MTAFRNRAEPSTTRNPWLRQAFDEQDRLGMSSEILARMAGVHIRVIHVLRQPNSGGKRPKFDEVRAVVEALGFEFPENLTKRGE